MEYNLDRCQRFVIKQAGNAIDAYIQCVGLKTFLDELKHRGTQRNPKYERLVSTYKQFGL